MAQIENPSYQREILATNPKCSSCNWFSPGTGIHISKHRSRQLPSNPFLDVVSFVFSHSHKGVSALIDSSSGFSISYSKLQKMVRSMASGLQEIGVSQGEVVLILLPNTIYYPVVFLSVLSIGAIATAMNPLSSPAEINKQISDCNVVLAFATYGRVGEIENMGVRVVEVLKSAAFDSS
uniref:4-coumarate--CoA ligase n=1 Tax=Nelumbo nucifera TaxID=4432 RepID=A0A822ZZH6_NELNU|nr:TPA_asm: hypothetical protein HUJ06_018173 [Nelumbo nucifera]